MHTWWWLCWCKVSIHTPHEGGDAWDMFDYDAEDVSIHTPHEGGDTLDDPHWTNFQVSIHTPHEGGD